MTETERLDVFNIILENLRQKICESDIKSEVDLEHLISLVLTIGLEELDLDDINSILNVLLKYIKDHTDQFPSILLLSFAKTFLEHLSVKYRKRSHHVYLSWPSDLRLIVQRLFQTFKISEEYLVYCYDLSCFASKALGVLWVMSDAKFAILLASLTSGRLRIVMENEEKINVEQLISCLSLLEDFMQCVEDDNSTDYLDDNAATSIGKSCQESATYVCEYIIELTKSAENSISRKMEYLLVLYRFLCAFFAIGGAKIINQLLLSSIFPTLLKVCQFCIEQRDAETSSLLLLSLNDFEQLNQNVLEVILEYFRLIFPSSHSKRGIIQICSVLEQLKERKGWYTENSLTDARELADTIGDKRFSELINELS